MKLDNKGITLVELIVSIALISIVIMFLFRLLVDVRYSDNTTDYNRNNQQTRAIIIKTIQNDFLERKLIGLTDRTQNEGEFILEFSYADHTTGRLVVLRDSVMYTNNLGTEKWNLEKENENTKIGINCVRYSTSLSTTDLKTEGEFFSVKLTIPVIVNTKKQNYIDDLEFFYIGEKKDISDLDTAFPNRADLGYYHANQCG